MTATAYFETRDDETGEILEIGSVPSGKTIFITKSTMPHPISKAEYETYLAFGFSIYQLSNFVWEMVDEWVVHRDRCVFQKGNITVYSDIDSLAKLRC